MEVEKYYKERFQEHIAGLVKNSNAHTHGADGTFISVHCLQPDFMRWIPEEEKVLFFYCLAFEILLDQIMYCHFRSEYQKFRGITKYLKLEFGLSSRCPNPWLIAHVGAGAVRFDIFERPFMKDTRSFIAFFDTEQERLFLEVSRFFIKQFKAVISDCFVEGVNWKSVRSAMLNDEDISEGKYGRLFIQLLIQEGEEE